MYEKVLTFETKEDYDRACMILGGNEIEHTGEYPYSAFCVAEAEWRITEGLTLPENLQYIFDNVLSDEEKKIAISYYEDTLKDAEILNYDYMDDLMRDDVEAVVNEWYEKFEKRVISIRIAEYDEKERLVKELVDFINSFSNEDFVERLCDIVNELEDGHVGTDKEKVNGYLELRVCNVCGKVMAQGYCIEDGEAYYCTDECMKEEMTKEEFEELNNNNEGSSYWTEWY